LKSGDPARFGLRQFLVLGLVDGETLNRRKNLVYVADDLFL